MKIRYLLRFGYGVNGVTRTVITQANQMAAAGHDVELVSLRRNQDRPRFPLNPRVRMFSLIDDRDRDTDWWREAAPLDERVSPLMGPGHAGTSAMFTELDERETARYVAGLRDGVLVTTQQPLSFYAAQYGSAQVLRVAQEHMNYGFYDASLHRLMATYFPALDVVAVLTESDKADYLKAFPPGQGGPELWRVPNALHQTARFPLAPLDSKIVCAVGRLHDQKGFDLLIEAFDQVATAHPDWQLRIYGGGPLRPALRAMIEKRHLYNHVLLMGVAADVDTEYPKSSLFVLSSRYEGFCMVMLEAMAHGLPVVSFDCPHGPSEAIEHGRNGLLVPPGDVSGLAAGLCKLIESHELRVQLGAAAHESVERYRPKVIRAQWEELFSEALAARGIPPG